MSKRVRYDGPSEVLVFDPEADVYAPPIDRVKPGGLLSKDVPARIRDELAQRADWTEQEDPAGSKKKEGD
jgi:hypothetical protein